MKTKINAIAFDRDNPLNQRMKLGERYNALVDEYNELEEKYLALVKGEDQETTNTQGDEQETPASEQSVEKPLEDMTVPELQAIAEDRGLDYKGLKKADLITLLKE